MHKLVNGIQVPLTPEEIAQRQQDEIAWNAGAFDRAMADLRSKRDRLLSSCDWVMMSDSPIADKSNWETYRQSLRDITNGLTTVEQVQAIVFPTKPA
ncbi:phage tail assembly chaperone [bacterium]|nr:phage tail assembly chaperone [bacterium]